MAFNLLFSLLISLTILSTSQVKGNSWHDEYPFIKRASSFSSSPAPSSSDSSSSSQSSSSAHGGVKTFDYIIVGGGTAGCPLAATLSQKFRVLLLERGGVPFDNLNVSLMENFHINLADISPTSASQMFISTDGVFNSRARVLGGGTSINAGFYSRAGTSFIEEVGWDPELVNESYPWVENQIIKFPKLSPWQKAIKDSLVDAGVSPDNGYTYNHLYGTKVGGTIFDDNDRRHTAAELLATANRKNIKVLIHARVQKIVFNGKKPRAIGVIFKDEYGHSHHAFISRKEGSEVLLTSGAIGSPQMLLLSGIGPKDELAKFNISVVLDNEFVGKDVQDNPLNMIFVPTRKHIKQSLIQTVGITKVGVYIEASCGFGQSNKSIHRNLNHGMFSAEIGQLSTIPPKERTWEAIEAYKKRKHTLPREIFKGGFILEKVAKPLSKGKITLNNTDVDENPNITFNYFSHPRDVQRCVNGIRIVEKLTQSKHFRYTKCAQKTFDRLLKLSVAANVNLIPKHMNDTKSLEQFCKDTVVTIWHYHGGCHVGKVVSSDYKVLGVDRLRVIDGSTFYNSPGTNPQATVMMMGRYMGVKILRERLGRAAAGV